VGFEPTIAVLERAKTVRALDRSTTAIGMGHNMKEKVFVIGEATEFPKALLTFPHFDKEPQSV
jgi:hypothetical protein